MRLRKRAEKPHPEELEQVIREFEQVKYYNHRLIELNLKAEELQHKLEWGVHAGPSETGRQAHKQAWGGYDYDTLEAIDALDAEIERCRNIILACSWFDVLDDSDKEFMIDRYWDEHSMTWMQDKYCYSRPGYAYHIDAVLKKLARRRLTRLNAGFDRA